ncbi:MAG: type VI secretion system tip protein VgrG [Polyangiaceae bacterium]|nr:type VI secretion system tip protein VgrG [Polyangiaceae bacterium]
MATLDPLRYFLEIGGQIHEVRELKGEEKVSSPFRFEAAFSIEMHELFDPDSLIKTGANIVLMRDGMVARRITGLITDISVGASIRGVFDVDVVVEPRLRLASYRTDMRVFRNMTVPEIVADTLSQIGVTPELRLSSSYDKRPYCVQYRETDLDFVHRLLEDEGIFYFFLPGDVMVLGDSAAAYEPIEGIPLVPYRAASGMDRQIDHVSTIGRKAALTVGKVTLRDWNPEMPSLDMDVEAAGPTAAGPEYYDYPGEYLTPPEGTKKAKLWSESFGTNARGYAGVASHPAFGAGFSFKLIDAPLPTFDRGYILLTVKHEYLRAGHSNPGSRVAEKGGSFALHFSALEDNITYRPPRVTYVPRILNPQTGIVTGPAGADDIYTDEYGRIKIHFHWDRRLPPDDDCSHWIPVLQDNTGSSSAIPRREWEMMVHFMEGDPDRPVVLGRVYNAEDRFPVPLPVRKFCTSLKSLSTPTRDGTNEIQIDDEGGKEYILIHAERDQNIVVANDKTETILFNENSLVRRDHSVTIGANHTLEVGRDMTPQVLANQTWSTGGNRNRKTAAAETATIMGNRTKTVGGMHMMQVDDSSSTTAQNLTEQVGGVILEVSNKSNGTEVGENGVRIVGGAIVELARENKSETAAKKRIEMVGGILFQKAKKELKITTGKQRKTKVGAILIADAKKHLSISAADELSVFSNTAVHEGKKTVTLKVGESTVLLKEGVIKFETPQIVTLKVSGENNQGTGKSEQI